VNRFIVCAEIRHFVMAITAADACDDFAQASHVAQSDTSRAKGLALT